MPILDLFYVVVFYDVKRCKSWYTPNNPNIVLLFFTSVLNMSNGMLLLLYSIRWVRLTFTNTLFKNTMVSVYKYKFQWTKFTTYNLKLPPDNITDIDKVLYVVTSNLSVIKLNIQKMFQCNISFANSQKEKFAGKWPPKSFYG